MFALIWLEPVYCILRRVASTLERVIVLIPGITLSLFNLQYIRKRCIEEERQMLKFLYRNLQGYRFLVILAVAMTFAQVGSDILLAFPLKFILDKIVNHRDTVFPFLNGLVNVFDGLGTRNGLHPGEIHTALG